MTRPTSGPFKKLGLFSNKKPKKERRWTLELKTRSGEVTIFVTCDPTWNAARRHDKEEYTNKKGNTDIIMQH